MDLAICLIDKKQVAPHLVGQKWYLCGNKKGDLKEIKGVTTVGGYYSKKEKINNQLIKLRNQA